MGTMLCLVFGLPRLLGLGLRALDLLFRARGARDWMWEGHVPPYILVGRGIRFIIAYGSEITRYRLHIEVRTFLDFLLNAEFVRRKISADWAQLPVRT